MENIYKPKILEIIDIVEETSDIKTFRLKADISYSPGQFGLYSVFSEGEAVFCIASSPTQKGYIECTVKKIGKVTQALHNLDLGDKIGFRGPYGNSFPIDLIKGKDLLFIGGGIGLAPLRSLLLYCLDKREDFGDITLLYGARSVDSLVYKDELNELSKKLNVFLTVDPGGETPDWKGKIGFVPTILEEIKPKAEDTFAITCGPPIMIKFVCAALEKLSFPDERIITTLEMKMKCGVSKCGRCNIGKLYVCKDGPVFTLKEIKTLPQEF
ncbi:MAG: FAD/NAD(P)-binding protein [bacterium]